MSNNQHKFSNLFTNFQASYVQLRYKLVFCFVTLQYFNLKYIFF